MPHILLLGGHGKVSQLLTPLLLQKSWSVTSVIRSPDQKATIEKLGQGQPGKLDVLVSSVEDVKSEADAKKILDSVRPEWVVWSAGAGGRGGASRTYAVDRDAAIAFTRASINNPSIKKFLTVSYLSSRRGRAPWWSDADWQYSQKVNNEILPTYYKAKLAADEVLTVFSRDRYQAEEAKGVPENERFTGISLRPGTLSDGSAGGVLLGKIKTEGKVPRATVAEVTVAALEAEGLGGSRWIDFLGGDEGVEDAIKRIVREGVDGVEGEDLEKARESLE